MHSVNIKFIQRRINMPRIARKYLGSSYTHIIIQGIDREYIFQEDSLKDAYKYILKKNLKETNTAVLAYCFMDNHAHFLVYNEQILSIEKLMRKTNTSFAKLYNKTKNRVGYVFRNRYYTQAILTETQLYNCIVYIHNNPIKANMCNYKKEYNYSSYNEYLGKRDLITKESIKLVFGSDKNYIETFKIIHQNKHIEDIVEVTDGIKNVDEIISEYLKNNNTTIEQVKKDNAMLGNLLIELRHYGGKSLREMEKIFNINRNKLNRIINKKI